MHDLLLVWDVESTRDRGRLTAGLVYGSKFLTLCYFCSYSS